MFWFGSKTSSTNIPYDGETSDEDFVMVSPPSAHNGTQTSSTRAPLSLSLRFAKKIDDDDDDIPLSKPVVSKTKLAIGSDNEIENTDDVDIPIEDQSDTENEAHASGEDESEPGEEFGEESEQESEEEPEEGSEEESEPEPGPAKTPPNPKFAPMVRVNKGPRE